MAMVAPWWGSGPTSLPSMQPVPEIYGWPVVRGTSVLCTESKDTCLPM